MPPRRKRAAAPARRSARFAEQDAANEKAEELANRTYEIGDRVAARWDARPEWFPGKVIAMNDDKTYDILYDDGDDELNVKPSLMKREGEPDPPSVDEKVKRDRKLKAEVAKMHASETAKQILREWEAEQRAMRSFNAVAKEEQRRSGATATAQGAAQSALGRTNAAAASQTTPLAGGGGAGDCSSSSSAARAIDQAALATMPPAAESLQRVADAVGGGAAVLARRDSSSGLSA